jgi:sortase (surface protein transpeptidase)
VQQKGASLTLQKENARYMDNTADERVTLISCWPYTSNTYRLIVIAKPLR